MSKIKFPWGEVIQTHDFFGVEIVEYHPKKMCPNSTCIVLNEIDYDKINYHVEDIHESFPSLDIAVLGILVNKYTGSNSRLTYPIARMLEMEDE